MVSPDLFEFSQVLILSLAVGGLIGLEREFTKRQEVAGLRTFALISLLGALSGFAAQFFNQDLLLGLAFLGVLSLTIVFYQSSLRKPQRGPFGLTTIMSLILTFLLGAAVSYGFVSQAIIAAVILTVVLFQRKQVHSFVSDLTREELKDSLEFVIVLTLMYFFVPSEPVEFYGMALPLRQLFAFIILMSLISLAGFYLSRKLKAANSSILTALAGGLVSGSAFALKLRQEVEKDKTLVSFFPAALFASFSTVLLRSLILAGFFSITFAYYMALPVTLMIILTSLIAFDYYKKAKTSKNVIKFKTPFSVSYGVKLALVFGVVILLSDVVKLYFNEVGFIASSFLLSVVSSSAVVANSAFLYSVQELSFAAAATVFVFGVIITITADILFLYLKETKHLFTSLLFRGGLIALTGFLSLLLLVYST